MEKSRLCHGLYMSGSDSDFDEFAEALLQDLPDNPSTPPPKRNPQKRKASPPPASPPPNSSILSDTIQKRYDVPFFRASRRWHVGFYKRNKISLRRATNNHTLTWDVREPRLKRFCAGLQRRVSAKPPNYYPIAKRFSLDQVPLCYGLNGKDTIEEKSTERVQVCTGKGDADQKRMATLQICTLNLSNDKWEDQPCTQHTAGVQVGR